MAKIKTPPKMETIEKPQAANIAKTISDLQNSALYGIPQNYVDRNEKVLTSLVSNIHEFLANSSPNSRIGQTSPGMLIDAVRNMQKEELAKRKKVGKTSTKFTDIKQVANTEPDFALFNELYGLAIPAFELFKEYDMLADMIPEGYRCFELLWRGVMSADNFTKKFIIPKYDEVTADQYDTGNDPSIKKVKIIRDIIEEYNLNDKFSTYLHDAMKYGNKPTMIIPIDDNFRNAAKEILKNESVHVDEFINKAYKHGKTVNLEQTLNLESAYVATENGDFKLSHVNKEALRFERCADLLMDGIFNDYIESLEIPNEDEMIAFESAVKRKKLNYKTYRSKSNRKKRTIAAAKTISKMVNENVKFSVASECLTMKAAAKAIRMRKMMYEHDSRIRKNDGEVLMESFSLDGISNAQFESMLADIEFDLNKMSISTESFDNVMAKVNPEDIPDSEIPKNDGLTPENLEANLEERNTTGSIIVPLAPDAVVPISVHGEHIGYYVIERVGADNLGTGVASTFGYRSQSSFFAMGVNSQLNSGTGSLSGPDGAGVIVKDMVDIPGSTRDSGNRINLLKKMLVRAVAERIGNPDIVDDKAFNAILYSLIKDDYIVNNEIRITYVPAHMMVYWAHEINKDNGMGVSVFHRGMFFGHIVIAMVITNTMISIAKSADREQYNVEMGIENKRLEATVNKVMRTLQSKRVSVDVINSIDTIMKRLGQFQRYISIRNNGTPMIEMETIPGQNVDMDSNFQVKALESYINSFSVPHSALNMLSQDEYSRSVAVNSALLLTKIVSMQDPYQECASKMVRILTRNRYPNKILTRQNINQIRKKQKDPNATYSSSITELIDLSKIEIDFPKPQGLTTNNTNELVSNAVSYINNFIEYLVPSDIKDDDQEAFKRILSYEMLKILVPGVPYDEFEELQTKVKRILQIQQLKNGGAKGDDYSGGSSSGGSSDSGGDSGDDPFGTSGDSGGDGNSGGEGNFDFGF